jgi:antitoxin component YwqK of YwqJK toxin-antitoxin module
MVRRFFPYFFSFFIFLPIAIGMSFTICSAQVKHGDTLEFKDVYDSAYGIKIYDAMNMNIGGDSTRSAAKGYALQGWMEDYYPNKQVLHKGYYIDGQLKAYKNYFPNGQLEREFKMTDLSKSAMTIYYQDGKIRSNISYTGSSVLKEEDYFPTGQLEYVEENDRKAGCYVQRKFYNQNGKPTSLLEITDQKRKIYSSKEYYDNGNIKEEGQVIYNDGIGDYQKNGKWKFYDERGKLKEEKTFAKGEESD